MTFKRFVYKSNPICRQLMHNLIDCRNEFHFIANKSPYFVSIVNIGHHFIEFICYLLQSDSDLCVSRGHPWSNKFVTPDEELDLHVELADDNTGSADIDVGEMAEEMSDELQLMKSFGLPTSFGSSRSINSYNATNKRKSKPKTKKNRKVFESSSAQITLQIYQNPIEEESAVLPEMLSTFTIDEDCVDANDANDDYVKSNEDKHEKKSSDEKQETGNSSSSPSNQVIACLMKKNDESDSDGPPEERPSQVKREHDSDHMELPLEVETDETTEEQSNEQESRYVTKNRKKRKSKYWHQRYRLFSRFDEGIKLDNESWYSVTPERIAQHIAHRFTSNGINVIIDAFCGAGGNTIQFACISPTIKVIAIDIDERKIGFAKHNAKIYGVDNRIEFIVGDYMLLAKTCALKADAVFLSPPWGGPKYLKQSVYTLDMMTPNGKDVFEVTNANITKNIGILLPRNVDVTQLEQLAGKGNSVEIEQNLVNSKVKTVTAYFADMIASNNQ